jgi:hypothetical protein
MKLREGPKRTTLNYYSVLLDCEFNYIPPFPGDAVDPPEGARAEFTAVKHKGECIYPMLSDDQLNELEVMALAQIGSDEL